MRYGKGRIVWTLVALAGAAPLVGRSLAAEAPTPTSTAKAAAAEAGLAKATFAGGCFWCMEPPFDELEGVVSTTSGYTGGQKKDPTYEEVSDGITGHAEAVEVVYNPKKISYERLLEVFWRNVDPTVRDRQFCDEGSQYRAAIFYQDAEQKRLAAKSKLEIEKSGKLSQPVVTQIVEATTFYPAEDYHQDYYRKNPVRYKYYRWGCKRDQRLGELWGDS